MISFSKIAFTASRRSSVFLSLALLFCTAFSSLSAAWQQPPQYLSSNFANAGDIASDANGHAIAVVDDGSTSQIYAYYYTSGFWSGSQVIGTPIFVANLNIDMDDTGTALVLWYDRIPGTISSAHYNGTSWSTPALDPLATISSDIFSDPVVSMNGANRGVALWGDSDTGIMQSSFFLGTNWSAPVTIATGQNVIRNAVAYSANGTAVAIWTTDTSVVAANYVGSVWQAPVVLDSIIGFPAISVGIDSSGRAHAIWNNTAGDVVIGTFNGTNWLPNQVISVGPGNTNTDIGVAPGGTAVAVWIDASGVGQSSAYNGTAWSAPFQFSPSAIEPSVSVDNSGDALVLWGVFVDPLYQVRSSRLGLGAGEWCPEQLVDDGVENNFGPGVTDITSSLSSNGTGFALYAAPGDRRTYFASATLPLASPTNIAIRTCANKFATQTDRVNIITWTASTDPTIRYYEVRRNGILVAIIPSDGPFVFEIHNLCRGVPITDVYTITAIGCGGETSVPVTVVFP